MPTYEYVCKDCGEHLEVVQSFKDEALTICPNCQGALKKVFGNVGIVFKGSGFYKTDSRSGAKTATAPAKTEAKSESKADSSSDSSSVPSGKADQATKTEAPVKKAESTSSAPKAAAS